MVDLATGEETTLFPNDDTPEPLRDWFTLPKGQFDVSADRRRVLLVDRMRGQAFEIRLADGEVLNVFRQLHDLSSLTGFPRQPRPVVRGGSSRLHDLSSLTGFPPPGFPEAWAKNAANRRAQ